MIIHIYISVRLYLYLNIKFYYYTSFDSLGAFNDNYEDESQITAEFFSLKIMKERLDFISLLENNSIKDKKFTDGSVNFWLRSQIILPLLSRLFLITYNIPASSAYVERFYSICGNICKQRSGNMSSDTIITRSMLKANMEILNKLTITQFND